MKIVFVGPPGAGKGTQASRLAAQMGIAHISTGEMIRAAIASGSELGLRVKAVNDRGELVSDDLMKQVVQSRLSGAADCRNGFILDGYPRTVPQVAHLDDILQKLSLGALDHVVLFEVPRSVLLDRVKARAAANVSAGGPTRADDDLSVAARRLDVYEQQTAPLISVFDQRGIVRRVNGVGSVDEVFSRVFSTLSTPSSAN